MKDVEFLSKKRGGGIEIGRAAEEQKSMELISGKVVSPVDLELIHTGIR